MSIKDKNDRKNIQQIKQKEIDVFVQDQDSPPFQYYLMREDKIDITLTTNANKGSETIEISAGHGFTAPPAITWIAIFEGGKYIQGQVKNVVSNTITLYNGLPANFTTNAIIIRGAVDMNVDALVTEQNFILKMRQTPIPIDIQTVQITIWNDAAQGDDGKFGDLAELPNGFRVFKENSLIDQSLGNYRTNSDFREFGGVVKYVDKAPTGTYGVEINFDIKKIYGTVLRYNPRHHIFRSVARDKLDTLKRFRISFMGQYTVGEE